MDRVVNPVRLLAYPLFEGVYLGNEKDTRHNSIALRNRVRDIVRARKEEIKEPGFIDNHVDFLTLIL